MRSREVKSFAQIVPVNVPVEEREREREKAGNGFN
jgi:hypothetical protein